jgi:membrane fusion protein, heavy metal efflux system
MTSRALSLLSTLAAALAAAGCLGVGRAEVVAKPASGEIRLTPETLRQGGIELAPATVRDFGSDLELAGRITFDDQRVAHVASPVSGRVVRLVAQLGERVAKGDPLAILDSPDLGGAASDLVKAQANASAAERDYRRQRELFAAHAAAERDLEAAESAYLQAAAELARSRAKVRLFQVRPDERVTQQYVLRSPIDGRVVARAANPGTEVQGLYSGGTALELFTVGQLDRVWVLADAFEIDLGKIAVGAPVTVHVVSFPERAFAGRVEWISSTVDPATRTAKLRCALDNPQGLLKPEMYASASLHVAGPPALVVPRAAILRQGEQTVVFVENGETADGALRFERRPVEVESEGEGSDSAVAVRSGLKAGDRVVTSGSILLLGMV